MLEKLAKQTAVYGISTIAVRFLSYLLTARLHAGVRAGGLRHRYRRLCVDSVRAGGAHHGARIGLFPLCGQADAAAAAAGGTEGEIAAQARAGKRHLFATAWGVTLLAASLFFLLTAFGRERVAEWMGEAYVAHPEYVLLVAAVVWFDVAACLPFSRLREQGRAMTFVGSRRSAWWSTSRWPSGSHWPDSTVRPSASGGFRGQPHCQRGDVQCHPADDRPHGARASTAGCWPRCWSIRCRCSSAA